MLRLFHNKERQDYKDMILKSKQKIEKRAQTMFPNVAYEILGYAEKPFRQGKFLL